MKSGRARALLAVQTLGPEGQAPGVDDFVLLGPFPSDARRAERDCGLWCPAHRTCSGGVTGKCHEKTSPTQTPVLSSQ